MLKKFFTLGVLGVATCGVLALPAQADTAIIQESDSLTVIEGYDNSAESSTVQESGVSSRRRSGSDNSSNNAVVQDTINTIEVYGEGNDAKSEQIQRSVIRERSGGRRVCRRYCD